MEGEGPNKSNLLSEKYLESEKQNQSVSWIFLQEGMNLLSLPLWAVPEMPPFMLMGRALALAQPDEWYSLCFWKCMLPSCPHGV